ncbi:hypothetical protein HY636_00985 [Candidatus Woesearchaeota archaeon]|nr:hypothetical protein [Candidatus Woesearchaeota archaeon]
MKLNKTVKKIAALSLGASMVGATLLGAMATADLGNFPTMFINADGKFDGVFVVGKNSKAEDIIGQNMLVSAVQVVAVKKTPIVGAAVTKTVSDGYEIGNKDFYLNMSVSKVDSQFTDSDLKTLLAEGTYVDNEGNNKVTETYKQTLYLDDVPTHLNFTTKLVHDQDDDAAPNAGVYLYLKDSTTYYTYNYTLKFDTPVTVDNSSSASMSADLEGTKLKIMGKDYSIVDAKYTTNDLKELKFLGGESLAWMSQGEKVTLTVSGTEHTVEMVDVTEVASSGEITACGFLVDGQSAWVDKGTTESVNGVVLGVTDGKAIHSEGQNTDVCQVAIGANSVTIRDQQEVKIGEDKITDVTSSYAIGYIDYNPSGSTAEQLKQIAYRVNPDDDALFLAAGDEYVDPVFGTFKIVFSELVEDNKEKIEVKASGKNGDLTFKNKDGKEVNIDMKTDTSADTLYLGKTTTNSEVDNMIFLKGNTCVGSTSVSECKGAKFLVSSGSNYEAHIVKISNLNLVDSKYSFEDLTYGTETNDVAFSNASISLSGISDGVTIKVDSDKKAINFTALGSGYTGNITGLTPVTLIMKTENEGFVVLNYTTYFGIGAQGSSYAQGNNVTQPKLMNISFAEYYDTGHAIANQFIGSASSSGVFADLLDMTPWYDSTDAVLELKMNEKGNVVGSTDTSYTFGKNDISDTDDDNRQTISNKGTWITIDDDSSKQSIVIEHPKVAAYGRVFIAPTTSTTEVSTAGTYTTEIQQIGVDQFKLDTEVTDVTAVNVVAVGGPCANSVVSALMGNPAECFTAMGIETGQGMIKLFEDATTGKVALVVAGQTAEDTRLAAQMVANYASYALKGDEVVAITVNEAALSWKTKAELAAEAAAAPAAAAPASLAEEIAPAPAPAVE